MSGEQNQPTSEEHRRLLDVLLHESAQTRDDDRYMLQQFAAIIAVAVALASGIIGLFYSNSLVLDAHSATGLLVYLFTPLVPIGLVAYATLLATTMTLRSYYLRSIEVRIHKLTDQCGETPIPSWGHFQLEVNGQGRAGGLPWLQWSLVYVIAALVSFGFIVLDLQKLPELRYRVLALIIDLIPISILILGARLSIAQGSSLWHSAQARLGERLQRTSKNFPEIDSPRVAKERTLLSFLLLPRNEEELLKSLFIPVSFIVGRWLAFQSPPMDNRRLWHLAGFWFVFEFLGYQARYLLNDIRDREVDSTQELGKRRFPSSLREDSFALSAAFGTFVGRLAIATV